MAIYKGHVMESSISVSYTHLDVYKRQVYSRGVLFYPLSPHDQLIVRGELGRVLAGRREGIPSDFLFRTGGDLSLIHI